MCGRCVDEKDKTAVGGLGSLEEETVAELAKECKKWGPGIKWQASGVCGTDFGGKFGEETDLAKFWSVTLLVWSIHIQRAAK